MTWLAGLVLTAMATEPTVPPPAKPESYELAWNAPAACPDAEMIHARIEALAPERSGGEGVMLVEGTVADLSTAFELTLHTEFLGQRSSRTLRATGCGELAEAAALVVAVALEPSLGGLPEVEEPTPAAAEPAPVVPARVAELDPPVASRPDIPSTPVPASPVRRRFFPSQAGLRIGPRLEYGSLPGVGGGVSLAALIMWPRVRVELEGVYLWPRSGDGPGTSGGVYQMGTVGARGCARLFAGRVEFPICVGIEAGAMRVVSRGLTPSKTLHFAWLAPSAGAGVAIGGERFGFFSLAEVGASAVGSRVRVGEETAFRSLPVSLRVIAGLEILFAIDRG